MESVLNLEPHEHNVKYIKHNNIYNFLNFLKKDHKIKIENYYSLLNSIEEFKLKNVYNFIYLRVCKIKKLGYDIRKLKKINQKINSYEFNKLLKEFIKSEKLYSIIVMNSLNVYFRPN
jgi:hypothetical protein